MSSENFKLKRNKVRTYFLKVAYDEVKQYNINYTLMINSSSVDEICSSFKKDMNVFVKNEPKKITNDHFSRDTIPSFLKNSDKSTYNFSENQDELLDKYFEYILQINKILLSDMKLNKKKSSILNKKASLILKPKSERSSSKLIYQISLSKNKPLLEKKHEFLSLKMDIKNLLQYCNINQLSLLQKSNHINLESNRRLSIKLDNLMFCKNNLIFQNKNIDKSAIRRYNSLGNNPLKHFQKKITNTMYKLRSNNLKDVIIEDKETEKDINELNMSKILNLYNRKSEFTNKNSINETINFSNIDESGLTNDLVSRKSKTSNFKLSKFVPSANDNMSKIPNLYNRKIEFTNKNSINETINLSNFDEGGLTNDLVKPKSKTSTFKSLKFVPSANDPKNYFNKKSSLDPNITFNIQDDPNLSIIQELKTNKFEELFRRKSLNEFMKEFDPILLGYFNNAMIFRVDDDGGEKSESQNTSPKILDVESIRCEENNEVNKISIITENSFNFSYSSKNDTFNKFS